MSLRNILVLVCLVASVQVLDSASVNFITKCKAEDLKCNRQSTQAAIAFFADGIKELDLEPLDPIYYKSMNASSNNLKFHLTDVTLTGLKDCVVKKLQRDVVKSKIFLRGLCNVNLDGLYDMNGRILILPVEGNGKIHVVLKKLLISVEADMAEKVKDGVKYWDIKSWRHTYELKDNAEIDLENLFNGNEALGNAVRGLFKTNANDVVAEVGPVIIRNLLSRVIKNIDKFFNKVPANELALD